jgi:signal peptidase I
MEPTLATGSVVIVDDAAYRNAVSPRRGDIVVFMPPIPSPNPFIKRIVAIPGDRFEIRDGLVWLNGKRSNEGYVKERTEYALAVRNYTLAVDGSPLDPTIAFIPPRAQWSQPDRIPKGCYIALGDNRNDSEDSHVWGLLCPGQTAFLGPKMRIMGRVTEAGRRF